MGKKNVYRSAQPITASGVPPTRRAARPGPRGGGYSRWHCSRRVRVEVASARRRRWPGVRNSGRSPCHPAAPCQCQCPPPASLSEHQQQLEPCIEPGAARWQPQWRTPWLAAWVTAIFDAGVMGPGRYTAVPVAAAVAQDGHGGGSLASPRPDLGPVFDSTSSVTVTTDNLRAPPAHLRLIRSSAFHLP